MQEVNSQHNAPVVVAVMGTTGTGKSTFIRLLTGDDKIYIGHELTSETFDIQTAQYTDQKTGRTVVLIDTPGFDDSRGLTDTDILKMISQTVGSVDSSQTRLNGLIYMHRISDPRIGYTSRKALRMFRALCGDDNLANVRIVTTNWSRVTEQEGKDREEALRNETFKLLLDAGAKLLRHDNTLGSAERIMSELIPLPVITTQLEIELQAGKKLLETSAGNILIEEMAKMEERYARELAELHQEMRRALEENDRAWRAELEHERRETQQKIESMEEQRRELEKNVKELRAEQARLQCVPTQKQAKSLGCIIV